MKQKLNNDKCHVEGRYANYFRIGQNAFEFVLEFIQLYSSNNNKEEHLHTRIITSPSYAKIFLEMLQKSIENYENTFGKISER